VEEKCPDVLKVLWDAEESNSATFHRTNCCAYSPLRVRHVGGNVIDKSISPNDDVELHRAPNAQSLNRAHHEGRTSTVAVGAAGETYVMPPGGTGMGSLNVMMPEGAMVAVGGSVMSPPGSAG